MFLFEMLTVTVPIVLEAAGWWQEAWFEECLSVRTQESGRCSGSGIKFFPRLECHRGWTIPGPKDSVFNQESRIMEAERNGRSLIAIKSRVSEVSGSTSLELVDVSTGTESKTYPLPAKFSRGDGMLDISIVNHRTFRHKTND